jgi:hypothetical protein
MRFTQGRQTDTKEHGIEEVENLQLLPGGM